MLTCSKQICTHNACWILEHFLAGLIIFERLPGRCGWLLLTEQSGGSIPFLQDGWLSGFGCDCYPMLSLFFSIALCFSLCFSIFTYFVICCFMLHCRLKNKYKINLMFSQYFSMFLYFAQCSSILLWCHTGWRVALGSYYFWLADSCWLTLDSTWWWTDNT